MSIKLIPKTNKCWWCGEPANSREHKHKRKDIAEVFAKEEAVLVKDNGRIVNIQGPRSKFLTFPKVLCINCNTTGSQPFDLAYDVFINYINLHRDEIIHTGKIDFSKIFMNDVFENKRNVIKYYLKHIFCRLASNNIHINNECVDFLNDTDILKYVYIKFEIRLDLVGLIDRIKATESDPGNLHIGPLTYIKSKDNDEIEVVYSSYIYRWFKIIYFYSDKIIEDIYPGYNQYNLNTIISVPALAVIHPEKYKTLTDDELSLEIEKSFNNKDNDIINNTFSKNPFLNIQ